MANLKVLGTPCTAHGIVNCPTCGSGTLAGSAGSSAVLVDRVIVQSPGDDIHPGGDYLTDATTAPTEITTMKIPASKNPAVILKASKKG